MAMFDVFKKKKEDDNVSVEFEDDFELSEEPQETENRIPPPPPKETGPKIEKPFTPGPSLPPLPRFPTLREGPKPEVAIPKPPEFPKTPSPPPKVVPEEDVMIPLYEPAREMPEIKPPSKPVMAVKPYIFVKVTQYKEVLESIDKVKDMLAEVKQTIADIRRFEAQETAKLQVCESIAVQISQIIEFFDKTFTGPEL